MQRSGPGAPLSRPPPLLGAAGAEIEGLQAVLSEMREMRGERPARPDELAMLVLEAELRDGWPAAKW